MTEQSISIERMEEAEQVDGLLHPLDADALFCHDRSTPLLCFT